MSYPRKQLTDKLTSLSKVLNQHVIECVVYRDVRKDTISHWVTELAAWMNKVNRLKCSSTFKAKNYKNTLFGEFGTTIDDAEMNLWLYQQLNEKYNATKQYPAFEITPELVNKLYITYTDIVSISLPILCSKDVKSANEWYRLLKPIFM